MIRSDQAWRETARHRPFRRLASLPIYRKATERGSRPFCVFERTVTDQRADCPRRRSWTCRGTSSRVYTIACNNDNNNNNDLQDINERDGHVVGSSPAPRYCTCFFFLPPAAFFFRQVQRSCVRNCQYDQTWCIDVTLNDRGSPSVSLSLIATHVARKSLFVACGSIRIRDCARNCARKVV